MDDDAKMRASREPMTIDQLKRHVDRRLRAKADKAEVRRLEKTIDGRLASTDRRTESIEDKLKSILRLLTDHGKQARRLDKVRTLVSRTPPGHSNP
jgi:TATA-binding protein-associated factor Taf7